MHDHRVHFRKGGINLTFLGSFLEFFYPPRAALVCSSHLFSFLYQNTSIHLKIEVRKTYKNATYGASSINVVSLQ